MMKNTKKLITILLMALTVGVQAQIRFFDGDYTGALERARAEEKELFVDFWASWCGPCKQMAAEVFTDKEVGDYFNSHFVCVQLDAEAPANAALVKRFGIDALPTLLFISREDKEISRITGAQSPEALLKQARTATGDELGYEQLYARYKKNKKDFGIQQQLLMEAQGFMMTQSGYNVEKWGVRIDNLFAEYLKNKKLENMINPVDFYILNLFHPQKEKEDPVFDFIVANYGRFMEAIDTLTVARYIVNMNNSYIIRLCKEGNTAYRESIKRVNGDLKPLYAGFEFGTLSVEEAITLLADATYNLYRKNVSEFFTKMNRYFEGKGKDVELSDYLQPLEDLAIAYEGQLPQEAYAPSILWIDKALAFGDEIMPSTRTRLLMMIGECLHKTGNTTKAKQSYNQAFLESARINSQYERASLQEGIRQGLEALGE